MADFKQMVDSPAGSSYVLQGNQAFALGVMHAGYHCADGYPGTPSTEIIDKSLAHVQDKIKVGWSVNEAVAVSLGMGHAIAGDDTVITMKTPGAFQAGDPITTAAFFDAPMGALVLFIATDLVPSSTQHVIDLRYWLDSSRIPVLEPRNHQDMYEIAFKAADISRKFNTMVVVLANGILCHSDGLIKTKEARAIKPREVPENLKQWMNMPNLARANYNKATTIRIPEIREWLNTSDLFEIENGNEDFKVVVSGESYIHVKETLNNLNLNPDIFSLKMSYPLPEKQLNDFITKDQKKTIVIEDGDRYLEQKLTLLGLEVTGKGKDSTITEWTPADLKKLFSKELKLDIIENTIKLSQNPPMRPPSICPGCPYRAFGLTIDKLRKQKKIYSSFGDIGCSTLIYFLNAIDTCLCMGGSDAMRQGFTLSRPEYAAKTISVLGDSCECHSGMDATRNAVFRNTPGVKVVLDNRITAMTGGQPAPSSNANLAGEPNKFDMKEALTAEKAKVVAVSSYDLKDLENKMNQALKDAEEGEFTTLVVEGPCVQEVDRKLKKRQVKINYDKCHKCGKCNICPGIKISDDKSPHFTNMCTNCGGNNQVCLQICPFGAIEIIDEEEIKSAKSPQNTELELPAIDDSKLTVKREDLPESLRLAIRGIGGQGNLFFGKVLAKVMLQTPYANENIVKGDTHGMAQLGGAVISSFSCGQVSSPVLTNNACDVLVAMEISEILRPGFLDLLKPQGAIIVNNFEALPIGTKKEDYPDSSKILEELKNLGINTILIDANKEAYKIGDHSGRSANVVILGLLSSYEPFSNIPEELWLKTIMDVSPNPTIKNLNYKAFMAGKQYNN